VPRPLVTRAVDAALDRSVVLGYTTIGLGVAGRGGRAELTPGDT
jgi:hypothetical protein